MARRGPPSALFGVALDVSGDEAIAKAMADTGSAVRNRVREALAGMAIEILSREQAGLAAHVKTGRTLGGFDVEMLETEKGLTARIGPFGSTGAGWKAIFQESGVKGPVTVRRFQRGSRGGYARKTITLKSGKHRRIKAVLGTFQRHVNIPARPFVKPAWEGVKGRVQATIEAAIEQAKKESGLA